MGRIFRLVRLVRIVKLYKQYKKRKEDSAKRRELQGQGGNFFEQEEVEESRVGKMLSDLTTRRVIVMVQQWTSRSSPSILLGLELGSQC
eukprot:scaffold2903_cov336-Prasinococcus_capsulatus_cf.AAC.7